MNMGLNFHVNGALHAACPAEKGMVSMWLCCTNMDSTIYPQSDSAQLLCIVLTKSMRTRRKITMGA